MDCFGKYNYNKEECLVCEQRIECMIKTFQDREQDIWFDSSSRPACYGSYKGKDCENCPFLKECTKMSVGLKRDFLRKGKKIRLSGKYKERGSWKEKSYY